MDRSRKILVVADSNVAADNLCKGLGTSVRCVRIGAGSDLDVQVRNILFFVESLRIVSP